MLNKITHPLIAKNQWQEIAQGSSNQLYRAQILDQKYVLRINASDELAFGVNRQREAKILTLIRTQSWAPLIIENNLEAGWCLMLDHGECAAANSPTTEKVLAWAKQLQLFSLNLSDEQVSCLPEMTFNHQLLFDHYAVLFSADSDKRLALRVCRKLGHALKVLPEVENTIIHQDLHPGNVLLNSFDGGLTVIDWEYGGWGTPWLDAASLNTEFGIHSENLSQLPVFGKLNQAQFEQGLAVSRLINQALACIWYWLRSDLEGFSVDKRQPYSKVQLCEQAEQILRQLTNLEKSG